MDEGGSRWTQVGAGGASKTISRTVWLYNLNDSVDLKDQLLSLSYLLKIFEMS